MAYYNTCPNCGSHLDPGEKCDCQNVTNCAQIGHENEMDFFIRSLEDFHKNDPAAFVSVCAMTQAMTNDESNKYGFQYPQSVFLEAIRYLENGRKQDSEDPDIYIKAIALICDKWIGNAPSVA